MNAFVGNGGSAGREFSNSGTNPARGAGAGGAGRGSGGSGGQAGVNGPTEGGGGGGGGGGASVVTVGQAFVRAGGGGGGGAGNWHIPGPNASDNTAGSLTVNAAQCGQPGDGQAGATTPNTAQTNNGNGGGGGGGGGGYAGAVGTGGTFGIDNPHANDPTQGQATGPGTGGGSCVLGNGSYQMSQVSASTSTDGVGGVGGNTPTNASSSTGLAGSAGRVKITVTLGPPTLTLACTPTLLTVEHPVETCTVTSNAPAPAGGLSVRIVPPSASNAYTTTCSDPLTIPAGSTAVSCEIRAESSAHDTGASATLTLQPNGGSYIVGSQSSATATILRGEPIPVDAPWALACLSAMLGLLAWRRQCPGGNRRG